MPLQFRQGDVLLSAVTVLPPTAKPVRRSGARVVLAEGELTGHTHALSATGVRIFEEKRTGRSFVMIGGDGSELQHEEHDPIALPPRLYEIVRQREYAPQAVRLVAD